MDVSKLKVADLKKELKTRGLSTTGAKNELMERLQEALKDESTDNTALENDDLIDEEAVLADETDEAILDEPSAQLTSHEDDAALLNPSGNAADQSAGSATIPASSEVVQPKKITINRKITVDAPKAEETEKKTDDEEATSASEEQSADKKVVKIGALSAEERAKLRAEKFGVPIPDVMKKAVRAERFGLAESKNTTTGNSQVDQEKLTKRQARFGIVADETDLKKQKRAERFGAGATKTSAVDDEKLRKRAERFGLS